MMTLFHLKGTELGLAVAQYHFRMITYLFNNMSVMIVCMCVCVYLYIEQSQNLSKYSLLQWLFIFLIFVQCHCGHFFVSVCMVSSVQTKVNIKTNGKKISVIFTQYQFVSFGILTFREELGSKSFLLNVSHFIRLTLLFSTNLHNHLFILFARVFFFCYLQDIWT